MGSYLWLSISITIHHATTYILYIHPCSKSDSECINWNSTDNLYSRRISPVGSRPWWGPRLWSPSSSTSSSYSAAAAGGGAERWWACHFEDQCSQFYYLCEQVLPWLLFYGGGIVTCIWSHLYYTSLCWREEKVSRSPSLLYCVRLIDHFIMYGWLMYIAYVPLQDRVIC